MCVCARACVCVHALPDAACFWSVNICMHVFRQSRAVLRIVTLPALLLPLPPVLTRSFLLTLSHFQMSAPPSLLLFVLLLPLVSHTLLHSLRAAPLLAAAIYLHVSLSSYSVSRAGKGIRCVLPCSAPRGLHSSHVLFILQVTTLCRWSISTCRGSWAITSFRLTSLS